MPLAAPAQMDVLTGLVGEALRQVEGEMKHVVGQQVGGLQHGKGDVVLRLQDLVDDDEEEREEKPDPKARWSVGQEKDVDKGPAAVEEGEDPKAAEHARDRIRAPPHTGHRSEADEDHEHGDDDPRERNVAGWVEELSHPRCPAHLFLGRQLHHPELEVLVVRSISDEVDVDQVRRDMNDGTEEGQNSDRDVEVDRVVHETKV
mmetsp:Transcript_46928/g.100481  ORF Transcript_46928/g.100481 Transcript_46928/m.100481 type:complete len:203 (-) Transcript_46928:2057-2665(-)